MTLRHIVTWKLAEIDLDKKSDQITQIKAGLETLPSLVPGILSLTVGVNVLAIDTNWDLTLLSEFADEQDFRAYVAHPEHQKVVAMIVPLIASRATVDFAA